MCKGFLQQEGFDYHKLRPAYPKWGMNTPISWFRLRRDRIQFPTHEQGGKDHETSGPCGDSYKCGGDIACCSYLHRTGVIRHVTLNTVDGWQNPDTFATVKVMSTYPATPPLPLLALCHEYRRSKRRCATVREMKEGPSGYNVEKPDFGADWQARLQVQFLFPK